MARTQILLKSPIRFLNLYQCNILGGNRLKINATALCAGEQKDHSKCREGVIHTEGAGGSVQLWEQEGSLCCFDSGLQKSQTNALGAWF